MLILVVGGDFGNLRFDDLRDGARTIHPPLLSALIDSVQERGGNRKGNFFITILPTRAARPSLIWHDAKRFGGVRHCDPSS